MTDWSTRLTWVLKPSALVRRRVSLPELEQLDDGGRVLAILTEARLLTVGDGEAPDDNAGLVQIWSLAGPPRRAFRTAGCSCWAPPPVRSGRP